MGLNRAGSAGGIRLWSRCHIDVIRGSIILFFGLGRRDVSDGFEQSPVVEPVDPFERGIFNRFEARHGPRLWITSALYRPLIVSAKALS